LWHKNSTDNVLPEGVRPVIKTLIGFVYGSESAEFKSAFGVAESVSRLRDATRRHSFGVLAEQAAAGTVRESRVRLQRVIPMVGNSFKPFFIGRFEVRGESVYLTGRFTMLGLVKIFMSIWFGFLLVAGITAVATGQGSPVLILGALGMFGAGVALVALGKWFARNDIAWLSNIIRSALGAQPAIVGTPVNAAPISLIQATPAIPMVLRVTALILVFSGAMGIWSAASGISSWQAGPGRSVITHFSSGFLRLGIGAYGFAMLGLAYGVYRRRRWAWQIGLGLIAAAAVGSIYQMLTSTDFPEGVVFRVIFCVLSLAVTLYWGWWWYAQRIHFSRVGHVRD